ncbi:adenosine receptor A2b-like [Physella acuta]|uniref:adenosine receptor A2b-like n=1 Tax=Physella acuta TaxID=109671 RepID=UPI0027DDF031|nr:adenosine receptor A2b-like [Physella acuta]
MTAYGFIFSWSGEEMVTKDEKDIYATIEVKLSHNVFIVVASIMIPMAVFINILVFCGILLYPGFHTSNNVLLLAIAAFDFTMGAVCLPMFILCYTSGTREYISGRKYLCLFKLITSLVSNDGALYCLMLLSLDRYLAILSPVRHHAWITFRRAIYITIVSAVYTVTKASLPLLGWNNYDYSIENLNERCNFYTTLPKPFIIWFLMVPNDSAVVLSTVVNIHTGFIVLRQLRAYKTQSANYSSEQKRRFRARVSSVKITMALTFVFIVMTVPYLCVLPFKLYQVFPDHIVETIKVYALLLTFGNSVVNGPVYAILRFEYRTVYTMMLTNLPWHWKKCLKKLHREKYTRFVASSVHSLSLEVEDHEMDVYGKDEAEWRHSLPSDSESRKAESSVDMAMVGITEGKMSDRWATVDKMKCRDSKAYSEVRHTSVMTERLASSAEGRRSTSV